MKENIKNNQGRSLVTLTVTIAVVAIVLRFGAEKVLKVTITQNESDALNTLKLISTSLENYAKDNVGVFPANFSILTQTKPAYIDKDYIGLSPVKGYNYKFLRLEAYGYSLLAEPTMCNFTGRKIYTITTGGVLMTEECGKKE